MAEIVIKHSPGMISVDAEYSNPSEEVIARLKRTHLYERLVGRLGEDRAKVFVEGHHPSFLPVDIPEAQAAIALQTDIDVPTLMIGRQVERTRE